MAEIPFEPYTGQSKLRFWCQKVLPLVYDESLSYYELLGKVVEYLNNTITDVSACEDNITALRDAFVKLQDYVNEQLEDFAPEVERIIDEMIDSGEFGEIVTDVVNGLIANEYSTSQGYAQFDYVLKDGKLYCAIVSTSGEWDATKWRETTVGADMQLLSQRLYNLNAGQVAYNEAETYDNNTVGKKLKDLNNFDDNLNAGQVAFDESASYDNNTVGKKLKDLNNFDDNLNAGQVAFDESASYDNNTVGKKLKNLNEFDNNLNAGQVGYNSEGTYNNATVGKELQELKGSLNTVENALSSWNAVTAVPLTIATGVTGNIFAFKLGKLLYVNLSRVICERSGWGTQAPLATFDTPQPMMSGVTAEIPIVNELDYKGVVRVTTNSIDLVPLQSGRCSYQMYSSGFAILQ